MFGREDKHNLQNLRGKIASQDARRAFSLLFEWACVESPLYVYPISRGNFSAIHLSQILDARPYADCEFGFKGSSNHIKWWFRKPCFANLGVEPDLILAEFPSSDFKRDEFEVTVDLHDHEEAKLLISFVDRLLIKP